MLKRHEGEILLKGGHAKTEVARPCRRLQNVPEFPELTWRNFQPTSRNSQRRAMAATCVQTPLTNDLCRDNLAVEKLWINNIWGGVAIVLAQARDCGANGLFGQTRECLGKMGLFRQSLLLPGFAQEPARRPRFCAGC
jgi:hypothetical protein